MSYDPIDDGLDAAAQQRIRDLVRGLPEDTPNMAWRGQLSSRIAEEAKRSRRRRWFMTFGRPAIGLALTASLAGVVFLRGAMPETVGPARGGRSLEAALVQAHRESQVAFDVAGSGLGNDPLEATPVSLDSWDESDVEAF